MAALLFCHFRVTKVKLKNEKISLIITVSKWDGMTHSIKFFVFSLLCCKYICDIYLGMLVFNDLHIFFFKKHAFSKHQAQNANRLRNMLEK